MSLVYILNDFGMEILPATPIALVIFLIQSLLFLALVLVADRLLRAYAASIRKLLWFWALMMLPLITVLANATPGNRADEYLAAALELPLFEVFLLESEVAMPDVGSATAASGALASVSASPTADSVRGETASVQSAGYWAWFVSIYGFVACVLLARLPLGWKQLAKLRREASGMVGERGARIYESVASQLGYSGLCQIKTTQDVESPISFGIRNPTILLPESYFEKLSDVEIQTALLHELSHIKNHDALRILLTKIVESVFFFQPLVWLASSKIRYLSELVADDSVLERGVGAVSYAATLVNLIELGSEPKHQYALSTGIFTAPKMLVSRVEHMLNDSLPHETELGGRRLLVSALVLLVAMLAMVQLAPRVSALGVERDLTRSAIADVETLVSSELLAQNNEELYLTLELSDTSAAVNEPMDFYIRLFYTINGIRNPRFTELDIPNSTVSLTGQPNQYEQMIDGVRYGVYEKRYVITPLSSGPLVIPGVQFLGEVVDGRDRFRDVSAFVEGVVVEVGG